MENVAPRGEGGPSPAWCRPAGASPARRRMSGPRSRSGPPGMVGDLASLPQEIRGDFLSLDCCRRPWPIVLQEESARRANRSLSS